MKKIIYILAVAMLWSFKASATDRDCAQYSTSEALAATSDSSTNTVSFVFSGKTARKGTTNADCATESSLEQEVSNNEPAAPAEPATPALTPQQECEAQGLYLIDCGDYTYCHKWAGGAGCN